MSSLTHRAEAGLLAASLATGRLSPVDPSDFSHPGYQSCYRALTNVVTTHPGMSDYALVQAVADRAQAPGLDATRLDELRRDAPPASHLDAYARMVQTEAFRRDVATQAERIATTAGQGDADPHTRRLADALTRQATLYAENRNTPTGPEHAPEPGSRAAAEERVLAGVIQYPEQAATIARIMPLESFTTSQRQAVAEHAISLASAGDPVDASIIAWELDRSRYLQRLTTGQPPPTPTEPDESLLQRLSTIPVTVTSALSTARDLLTADIHKELTADGGQPAAKATLNINTGIDPQHQQQHRPVPATLQATQPPRINGGPA